MTDKKDENAMAEDGSGVARTNFIRDIVDADLESGKYGGRVVTRFPPEPNGYLHIGHAKSICLNFGLARDYGGQCNLRFDDTNPTKENVEYAEAIQGDVRWLGFDWGENLFFASDYFEQLYQYAVELIEKGSAYVCSLNEEEIREYRGTLSEPGRNSPYRERTIAENLDLFARMRAGEFEDGSHVLRARIDMTAANMKMRDPLLYRIRHAHHYRTGDEWCIYPMYDFAHCLEDAIEGVTHSICTLEFENNRDIYDWILRELAFDTPPEQTEFARLGLGYTIMSKRKLLQLVEGGHVEGWDDPRMPTIAGMRRRGYRPEAIRAFCDMIGVAKANSTVDMGKLEFCVRDDLNAEVPRVMGVLRPLKVVLTNYPEGEVEQLDAALYPHDVPKEGSRKVPFSRELFIDRDDFQEEPPKKFFRLAPGREVRLRYGYLITCTDVVKNEAGEVVELHCTYDPETRGGQAPDGRKVKGTIHWVSAAEAVPVEVRLYDRLFSAEAPGADGGDLIADLHPESLEVLSDSVVEPSIRDDPPGTRYQLERQGYFMTDPVQSSADHLVFNRIVGLRDSWAKIAAKEEPASKSKEERGGSQPSKDATPGAEKKSRPDFRDRFRAENPAFAAKMAHFVSDLGVTTDDADVLTGGEEIAAFFEDALATHNAPSAVAKWVVNEVLRAIKDTPISELPFGGAELGSLVALIDNGTISGKIAKDVFAEMMANGGAPEQIVKAKGLEQLDDPSALGQIIDDVLAANAAEVTRYREGTTQLFGFFVGQVMSATKGRANPPLVQSLLTEKLGQE